MKEVRRVSPSKPSAVAAKERPSSFSGLIRKGIHVLQVKYDKTEARGSEVWDSEVWEILVNSRNPKYAFSSESVRKLSLSLEVLFLERICGKVQIRRKKIHSQGVRKTLGSFWSVSHCSGGFSKRLLYLVVRRYSEDLSVAALSGHINVKTGTTLSFTPRSLCCTLTWAF